MVTRLPVSHPVESLYSNKIQRQQPSPKTATTLSPLSTKTADTVTISQSSRDLLAGQAANAGKSMTLFETDQGSMSLDINAYFSPAANARQEGSLSQSLPPLLLPSQENVDALVNHLSTTMPQFLAENNIPSAPSSIRYDSEGRVQLPEDYAYAAEFNEALSKNPAMERELRTVNALSSHLTEMKKSASFQQEYAAAATEAAAKAVVTKYSQMFSGNRSYDAISLNFTATGHLSITAAGKPLA